MKRNLFAELMEGFDALQKQRETGMITSHWNYRMVLHEHPTDPIITIHEVYYDAAGIPKVISKEPAVVSGDDVEELGRVISKITDALTQPVLHAKDFKISVG